VWDTKFPAHRGVSFPFGILLLHADIRFPAGGIAHFHIAALTLHTARERVKIFDKLFDGIGCGHEGDFLP
jgi:hypothetical protein